MLWVLRSGAHWQDLAERYGKWKTAHKRVRRGQRPGCGRRSSPISSRKPVSDAPLDPGAGSPPHGDRPGADAQKQSVIRLLERSRDGPSPTRNGSIMGMCA
ncbi:transposase [Brevundimonas intermedia]|uniref:Transposase n=1 Tax=Brevundimonas intermedia TaxID=74315 RepID=A0A4Y9S2L3_9CAUL|nr:transposase [Brevundimonas intermedia]